jgi:structural maintenance of chromosomes protein 6
MRPVSINIRQVPRMKTDVEGQIDIQRESLAQLEREMNDLDGQRRVLQQKLSRCQQDIVQHKRTLGQLKLQRQRAEDLVERLQGEYDQVNVEDGRLDVLKGQLRDANSTRLSYGSPSMPGYCKKHK